MLRCVITTKSLTNLNWIDEAQCPLLHELAVKFVLVRRQTEVFPVEWQLTKYLIGSINYLGYYRRLFDWKETEFLNQRTDGNFHFFHGETHSYAIAWASAERHEGVGTPIGLIFGTPPFRKIKTVVRTVQAIHFGSGTNLSGSNFSGSG